MVLSKYWPIESCLKFLNQSHVVAQAGKIMGVRYNKCQSGVVLSRHIEIHKGENVLCIERSAKLQTKKIIVV